MIQKIKRKYSSKLDEYKGIIIEKVDDFSANGRAIYNFIKEKGYDIHTPIVITNSDDLKSFEILKGKTVGGETVVVEYIK